MLEVPHRFRHISSNYKTSHINTALIAEVYQIYREKYRYVIGIGDCFKPPKISVEDNNKLNNSTEQCCA